MKYGTDIIDTKIPVGIFTNISTPITSMSLTKIKIEEMKVADGIKNLASEPTIFLAIWGPINPKKKKLPPNATEALDIATADIVKITNSFLISTPIPLAMS